MNTKSASYKGKKKGGSKTKTSKKRSLLNTMVEKRNTIEKKRPGLLLGKEGSFGILEILDVFGFFS